MPKGSQIQTGKIATYNLGEKGIVITKSPVHGEDGELAIAQNAVPNPEGGLSGLRKRHGFRALNATAAAGGILAFISCNLEDPGVIAVNPSTFGRWLYSSDAGVTWVYLDIVQVADAGDIPINYDGFSRLAFLHLTEDTDKTGLKAIDQVAGVNTWEASAIPAAGDDPGRVPYTIPHTLDLGDGFLYYWAADGLSIRRWGYGADAELVNFGAAITGIVDWDTDGTNIWVLTTVPMGGGLPDTQQVYKVTVSAGTAAKVGAGLASTSTTIEGTVQTYRTFYSLVVINLNGTTPTVVIGGTEWKLETQNNSYYRQALVVKLDGGANDSTAPTDILSQYDTQPVPYGGTYSQASASVQQNLSAPSRSWFDIVGGTYQGPYQEPVGGTDVISSYQSPAPTISQFTAGDTVTAGDVTYTAVEYANVNDAPYNFYRGGLISTTRNVSYPIDPAYPHGYNDYTYIDGLVALGNAINGGGSGASTSVSANALVECIQSSGGTLVVQARAIGPAGNGIPVSDTSSIVTWNASTTAGGLEWGGVALKIAQGKVTDLINDSTSGIIYAAVSSTLGHSEIKKFSYPLIAGAWSPAWTNARTQLFPFGYISVWADDDELLYLETPEAITMQLSKGVKVATAVFFLAGTGLATSATLTLVALSAGALQRITLP